MLSRSMARWSSSAAQASSHSFRRPSLHNLLCIPTRSITWKKSKAQCTLNPGSRAQSTGNPSQPALRELPGVAELRTRESLDRLRAEIDKTGLRDIAKPVPVETSPGMSEDSYPISEPLLRLLLHMSDITIDAFGMGCAAPQLGVPYRALVIRSELFGLASALTDIPYFLTTKPETSAAAPPSDLLSEYSPPALYPFGVSAAYASDHEGVNPALVSPRFYATHAPQQWTESEYLAAQPIQYPIDVVLAHTHASALTQQHYDTSMCRSIRKFTDTDGSLGTPATVRASVADAAAAVRTQPQVTAPSVSHESFLRMYGGYALPQQKMEQAVLGPVLSYFNDRLPATAVLNPRVVGVRDEWIAGREGCFSVPSWVAFVDRPLAVDIEYDTVFFDGAPIPRFQEQCRGAVYLSAPLGGPDRKPPAQLPRSLTEPPKQRFDTEEIEAAAGALDAATVQKYSGFTTDRTLMAVLERYSVPPKGSVKVVRRRVTARDMAARLLLHEIDHLDGLTFIDRTSAEAMTWAPPPYDLERVPALKLCYPIKFDSKHD